MLNDVGTKQAIGVDVWIGIWYFSTLPGGYGSGFFSSWSKTRLCCILRLAHCNTFAGKNREYRSALDDVRQMGYRDDLCQDGRAEPTHSRARPMRVGSGVAAAEKLFTRYNIDRESIDFLLFARKPRLHPAHHGLHNAASPGATYFDRRVGFQPGMLGLCLWIVDGRRSDPQRHSKRVLLITAETYSKYIDPSDRSLRTIFGDGAAATLVEASAEPSLGQFIFGTDGRGANTLMVTEGGARPKGRRNPAQQTQTLAQQPVHGWTGISQVLPRRSAAHDRPAFGTVEMDPR